MAKYPTNASIDVLLSKEWFELRDQSKPLTAGTSLVFCFKSKITFKSKVSYHSIAVCGKIKRVDYVDFEQEDCHRNPVGTHVQRYELPKALSSIFPTMDTP